MFEERLSDKIWQLLTNAHANMDRYSGYYAQLNENFTGHMLPSKRIVVLDIKRTCYSITSDDVKEKMLRILYNYSKRNMEIGYCQGMNFMCFYFLDSGYSEEETFWILDHIFENLIPKNYYINMVPIIADIKLLLFILSYKNPKLVAHMQKLGVDLSFVLIPWFVMAFANIPNNPVI